MGNTAKNDTLRGQEVIVIAHTPILKAIFSAAIASEFGSDLEYYWYDFSNGAKVMVDVDPSGDMSLAGEEGISFRATQKYKKTG